MSEEEARHEAQRCLSCGNCFECDGCYAACPEDAIIKLGPGSRYRYDYDRTAPAARCASSSVPATRSRWCPNPGPRARRRVISDDRPANRDHGWQQAVAHVAYRVNEVCAIYPITPSSTMAELADEWAAEGLTNIWGTSPWSRRCKAKAAPPGRCTARCRRAR